MKKFKKMMALVLSMVMVLAMNTTVFAASITINPGDNVTGTVSTKYTYYGLLKASIKGDAVSYYLPSPANDNLKEQLEAVTITKGEEEVDVFTFKKSADGSRWNATINTSITDDDGVALADALNKDEIKNNALNQGDFSQEGENAQAKELNEGYYLITSNLGSKLVLKTLGDEIINTKNEYFTDIKTANKTNMEVGDIVTYTITIHIPETVKVGDEITVHDTLDSNLKIDESTISATCKTNSVILESGKKKKETETFAKKFTVTKEMLNGDVVITYDAELLSTAVDDNGYVNSSFANNSAYETHPSEAKVWTFDFDLDKDFQGVTGVNAENYEATFELKDSDGKTIQFIKDTTGYVKADSDDENASATLTINGKDNINIRGLAAGQYTLIEKTTAEGYNLLTDVIVVTIADTSNGTDVSHLVTYQIGSDEEATGTVTVINNTGSTLPSTGGIGTTIFYVVGAVLIIGAGVLLVTRKRMRSE